MAEDLQAQIDEQRESLRELRQELYGPEGRPNGWIGRLEANRKTIRTMVAGVGITAIGAIVLQVFNAG